MSPAENNFSYCAIHPLLLIFNTGYPNQKYLQVLTFIPGKDLQN